VSTDAVALPRRAWSVPLNRIAPRLGILAFIGGIGYLTVYPLVRLQ